MPGFTWQGPLSETSIITVLKLWFVAKAQPAAATAGERLRPALQQTRVLILAERSDATAFTTMINDSAEFDLQSTNGTRT